MSVALNAAQERAVAARGTDLCVEAGAGTGKTRVLTERVTRLVLDDGVPLARILAITFTEKAAQEMKARLARALLERGRRTAREEVEAAAVSTVHAFCARILREHCVEAGLDPGFAVLDETEGAALEREALDALVAELHRETPETLDALAALPGGSPEDALLELYRAARESTDATGAFVRRVPGGIDVAAALGHVRAALGRAAAVRDDGTAAGSARIDAALALGEALAPTDAEPDALAAAAHALRGGFDLRAGSALQKDALRGVRETTDLLLGALADVALLPLRATLATTLERLEALHDAAKGHGARLDFADLERRAVALLETSADVRDAVRARFAEVLVDEFQDTNPVQARLLELVRRPGALFVVGDPKQSIYGFRGADVDVFLARLDAAGGAGLVRLTESYRARPELTGVVNALFAAGVSQPDPTREVRGVPYEPLVAPRTFAPRAQPAVECASFVAESSAEGRRAEARFVADRIVALVAGPEPLRVAAPTEDDPLATRPATWGDVAVLLRATTHVKLLERALTARDVPYLVVKGRGFYEAREVVDVANLLACVDDPNDDVRFAAVLRSPCCGASDDALYALAAARGDGRLHTALARLVAGEHVPVSVDADDARRLRAFAALHAELRAGRAVLPLAELVDRALAATSLDLAVLARPNGRQRAANLRKVREMALAADRAGGVSLREFGARLRELRQREVRETEAPVAGAALGAVRLLTVHTAKGLEFPIVFVPDLGREAAAEGGALVVHVRDGVGLRGALPASHPLADVTPASHAFVRERNTARAAAEEQRLLYVALTRAEEHLVVTASLTESRERPRPWWDRVAGLLDAATPVADAAADADDAAGPARLDVGCGADPAAATRAHVLRHAAADASAGEHAAASRMLLDGIARELAAGDVPAQDAGPAARAAAAALCAEAERGVPAAGGTLYATTVSALVTFARCPEEFRRRHLLGIPDALDFAPRSEGDDDVPAASAERPGDDDEWGVALGARALGRAAHAALERLVPEFADDTTTVVREALRAETGGAAPAPDDVARLVAWVDGFAAGDVGRALRDVPRAAVRREQAVLLRHGRTAVRGQIDLLFHSGATVGAATGTGATGWTIVDHKAGAVAPHAADYALQMRLYALAVEGISGAPPERVLLWSLPEARAIDVPVSATDLAALRDGLLAEFARATQGGDYTPRGPTPCASCGYRTSCSLARLD